MNDHINRIKTFMQGARQHTPSCPTLPPEDVRLLRARLIMEEAIETVVALGFEPIVKTTVTVEEAGCEVEVPIELDDLFGRLTFKSQPHWTDLTDIADGVADISVVAHGTALACGIQMDPILKCVDENNLAKLLPVPTFDENNKLKKPPGHPRPDIASELKKQCS